MIYSYQPRIYAKLKGSLFTITFIISISFIFFAIKYSETVSQKREEKLIGILKNNYFLELNKFVFRKINSPYLSIVHKIKKGENLHNVFKNYNIDQKDISKANSKLKNFIKPSNLKTGTILDMVIKKNILGI